MKLWLQSQSQSFQESFVLNMISEKTDGFFIEIGSNHPKKFNNTFLLETQFGWRGFGFELDNRLVRLYNKVRKNKAICTDATTFDYLNFFQLSKLPVVIDYLQLDIEPAHQTFEALKKIPFDDYQFNVITYEHDLYSNENNRDFKDRAYDYLTSKGYCRVVDNVCSNNKPYEDWYVHNSIANLKHVEEFYSTNINDTNLFSSAKLI